MATSARNANHSPLIIEGSFTLLLNSYGWNELHNIDDWNNYTYTNPNANGYNDLLSPFYVVKSGDMYNSFGGVIEVNQQGRIWGSTASDVEHNAYNYTHMLELLQPTNIWAREIALSLRF